MNFYSIHYNRPDFISIQKKYLIGGELFVINNGSNPEIENECKRLNIPYSNCDNKNLSTSESHGNALNYLAKNIINYTESYVIMEHDVFLFKAINFEHYDILGLKQTVNNHDYLWPGFIACKNNIDLRNINFNPNADFAGDTGCGTYKIIESKQYNINFLNQVLIGENTTGELQTSAVVTKIGEIAFHYLNGSSWMKESEPIRNQKNQMIINLLEEQTILQTNHRL
jgi:hypothetical protein